jgi:hypothetical protein
MLEQLAFSLPEVLALLGLAQCVYILVHMGLRAGRGSHAGLPAAYFATLGLAFFLDMAGPSLVFVSQAYAHVALAAWLALPPIAAVLVVQLSIIPDGPRLRDFWPLLPTALALAVPWALPPEERGAWLALLAFAAGGVSLAALWGRPGLFLALRKDSHRYWLALALIAANTVLLALTLASLANLLPPDTFAPTRNILGLALVYLAMTSVLRVYPQAVQLHTEPARRDLTQAEEALAARIEALLDLDKVYHEPAYTRGGHGARTWGERGAGLPRGDGPLRGKPAQGPEHTSRGGRAAPVAGN